MVMIEELRLNPAGTALILTDFQPDFMPGGALAVAGGDEIVPSAVQLLRRDFFAVAIATQDWHPPGHISFASSHPERRVLDVIDLYGHPQILWPDHCVQGSAGAELDPRVPWERVSAIVRKGNDPLADSYSTFRNNWGPDGTRRATGLAGYLKERHITDVVLCGLARDFCLKWSAEDAAAAGFRTIFLWDLSRPVDPASDEQVQRDLELAGVEVVRGMEGM
jgi:nicotinamidase/pyrazinamidase